MITPSTLALTTLLVVLVVGTKKIRYIGEDLGAAVRNFKKGLNGEHIADEANTENTSANNAPSKKI